MFEQNVTHLLQFLDFRFANQCLFLSVSVTCHEIPACIQTAVLLFFLIDSVLFYNPSLSKLWQDLQAIVGQPKCDWIAQMQTQRHGRAKPYIQLPTCLFVIINFSNLICLTFLHKYTILYVKSEIKRSPKICEFLKHPPSSWLCWAGSCT